ncbi:hypothetical protein S40288_10426, partial [Stachybotrys chartarum IBT 40288]
MACRSGPVSHTPSIGSLEFADTLDDQRRSLMRSYSNDSQCTLVSGPYPLDLCANNEDWNGHWWLRLLTDPAYLDSTLFNMSALIDIRGYRSQRGTHDHAFVVDLPTEMADILSDRTRDYFDRTIRYLQHRVQDPEKQLSDSTITLVLSLAMMAELTGDDAAFEQHVGGLTKIVQLRGGLETFKNHNILRIKICRVDLGWAIKTGNKPNFQPDIKWTSCTAAVLGSLSLNHLATCSSIDALLLPLDWRLYN